MKALLRVAVAVLFVCLVAVCTIIFDRSTPVAAGGSDGAEIRSDSGQNVLIVKGLGEVYRTSGMISEPRVLSLADSTTSIVTWDVDGKAFYAVSLDGRGISRVTEADHRVMLRYSEFDPLVSIPVLPSSLASRNGQAGGERTYIVQFITQPIDEYHRGLSEAGARELIYLPNYSYLVSMDDKAYVAVSALPFVRWIGRYEPAYKLEETLVERLSATPTDLAAARYNVMAIERGADAQNDIGSMIERVGGTVDKIIPEGFRMEATLTGEQLLELAQHEKVMFIDRWSAPENDMDVVRNVGGANFIDTVEGFRGQGVRAEVMDNGLRQTHSDFQTGGPAIIHNSLNTTESSPHGTSTYGINFGRGTVNGAGKGMMPEATGIFADYDFLSNRYTHTAELRQDPYKAVYQSNSWGSSLTTAYTTISAEMDDILFINDFTLLNSQSNNGNQSSRPQAWAKNVVSIGGIRHFNTASFTDDRWQSGASVGPAADGRIKPDLAHFYDSIFTTTNSSDSGYTTGFGGTSAATPITAGHFGIFFQMWHARAFGNPIGGATVFDSRPHMSTAKAVMINTATQWDMTIAGTDVTRVRQGFGRADLTNLYRLKNGIFIKDETDVLTNLQTKTYQLAVSAESLRVPLKITMVYTDPMGSPGATRTRLNDLTLKVTAPDGTIYWGNVGLGIGGGMWSTPGGSANIVDTVENVFIERPMAGVWTIEVMASELVVDARVETPGVIDADYALVVSGPLAPRDRGSVAGRRRR
ncbi:MAG: S8 family serine peptidase [Pyrinomonadaceae bacterium]